MKHLSRAALLAALLALPFAPAGAGSDRPPDAQERALIEARLTALGFQSWEDIELDDEQNVWEIEDARHSDGKDYDLELHPSTLEVLRQDRD